MRVMKSNKLLVALVGLSFFSMVANAHAIIVTGERMEWVLAKSDRVVVGKVIKVEKIAAAEVFDHDKVTIAISRTLKGETTDRATFVLFDPNDRGYARHWRDDELPMLFCLVKNDGMRIPA